MATPAMKTSFDVVCAVSLQRHYTVREMVLEGLKKSRPQSDQNESELQRLSDEATTEMRNHLLEDFEESDDPLSAECFAERWDYMLWIIYRMFDIPFYHRRPIPARRD